MDTIKITNRGFQRHFKVTKYTIRDGAYLDLSPAESALLSKNALELQVARPGDIGFAVVTLPSGKVRLKNTSSGRQRRALEFHVPLVLLPAGATVEVSKEDFLEILKDPATLAHIKALRGQPEGLVFQVPNEPPFSAYFGG